MRPFHLIDLYSQMPYLPLEMREWSPERVLGWMCQFGEVWQLRLNCTPDYRRLREGDTISDESHTFAFRSWIGRDVAFEYPAPGEMYRPGTGRHGWSSYSRSADEADT